MRKFLFDISASKNYIVANLEMVERRDPDNIPRFPPQEWCAWTIPEIALKDCYIANLFQIGIKSMFKKIGHKIDGSNFNTGPRSR